jgi:nucleolar GTP-binding protein
MNSFDLKTLNCVPNGLQLIDNILSRSQRKTPTIVNNSWPIERIRKFYLRKVKFLQSICNEKLTAIIDQFPTLSELHPLYSDILNQLYDEDHYKLALGHLNNGRKIINMLSREYGRLLKYGDSLYRCKKLKKAAFGRICSIKKNLSSSLVYLDQLRRHISRFPTIDPSTRSLLICGYPNVGKTSLLNKLTNANVEVQPYGFTTKSLFVGHMDYKYLRWQVIDTPGILERPFEERNTIEMQSITALVHMRACIIYIVDVSETCGYDLEKQVTLFHSLKPLFSKKPILLVCNKIDTMKPDDFPLKSRILLDSICVPKTESSNEVSINASKYEKVELLYMSTLAETGVMAVKKIACDKLLKSITESKIRNKTNGELLSRNNVSNDMLNPLGATVKPHNFNFPETKCHLNEKYTMFKNKFVNIKHKSTYLENKKINSITSKASRNTNQHTYDDKSANYTSTIFPEILNGLNISDFLEKDLEKKMNKLEREHEKLTNEWQSYIERTSSG